MDRIARINQAIKEEVSQIIQREVKDPRLGFVTITQVEVSRDLQHAKVYFSVLGDAVKIDDVQHGLDSARGFIRKLIGQRIRMRYTPEISFYYEQSLEYGMRIEKAIERIKDELQSDSEDDQKT